MGYDDNHLARLVKAGAITRIRQGAYAASEVWRSLDERDRHLLLVEAVGKQYDDDIAFSHDSGVLVLGGPDHRLDLAAVNITHFDQRGARRAAGVVHHRGECRLLDVTRVDAGWCTSPARTVLDVAMKHGLEVGVVVADDFLRRGLTTHADLAQLYRQVMHWPGALILRLVISLATGKAESVGESLGWLLFRNQSVPRPRQQFEVFHPSGHLAGRTDWAWPERRLLGEFDGKRKYLRDRRPGESIEECVMREKAREDLLRELTDWRFIRLVWADLYQPKRTAERVLAKMAQAA
jgi:hypothetical protein